MNTRGKLAAGLVSAGAVAALLPASAGANICVTLCGGGGGETAGLTTAVTSIASYANLDGGAQTAEAVIVDRLAGNHNETVLTLA
jgi:hypothetical protein